MRDVGGAADIRNSFGRIEAGSVRRGLKAISGNSNVTVSDITGDVYVKTSFGLAKAERIGGSLTIVTAPRATTGSNSMRRAKHSRSWVATATSIGCTSMIRRTERASKASR